MAGLRIGLTGGIGSGKSTVAALLVDHGLTLVDTDAIARRIAAPGGIAIPALRQCFGDDAIAADGGLDRARMRERVFEDDSARAALESILHPLIGQQAEAEASAAQGPVLFDVPLLVESSRWRSRVDRVLVVDCRVETQVTRVAARPGWTAELATSVVAQQASRALRRAAADAVIYNDGLDLAALAGEVEQLARRWALTAS